MIREAKIKVEFLQAFFISMEVRALKILRSPDRAEDEKSAIILWIPAFAGMTAILKG